MAGNEEFIIVEMATIWKLVHTCLIPILTYGAETWMPTKAELTYVQIIMYIPIKRILQAPMTTPSEIITKTGIRDIETQVAKKQITYYHRIRTTNNPETQLFKTMMDPKNPWINLVENTMRDIEMDEEELLTKKQPISYEVYYRENKRIPNQ